METQKITPGKFGMNYGLYLGGLMVIISILMYATDMALEGTQWPVYLYYVAFPVIILFAISKYKKLNANALSLGEALKLGLIIAVISALVYVAYIFIFNYLIDTEFNNKMIEAAETKIAESELPVETKEAQLKMVKMFSSPSVGSLAWIALSMIFGLVYSLIGGLVMKREASND
jgi:hypothetical protein